jgi:hypothetical protein
VSAVPADDAPILGSTLPRVYTPPLVTGPPGPCGCGCAITPDTSFGFDVDDFARYVLDQPLDPWQRWLVIHAGELLPDGRPRFRTVLLLVSRQVGKTHLGMVLTLYWLFVERQPLVLGTSTVRDTAKESWRAAVIAAETCEHLSAELGGVRAANGEETLSTVHGCRYRIAASNRRGGRGMTVNRLILDELREHSTYEAWDAAVPATNAIPDAQIWALTNQGGDDSVVLHGLHTAATAYLTTGVGDRRLGLFEWSAPPGSDPTDPHALAQACPAFGRRTDPDALMGMAVRAKNAGGAELASFRTEIMCMKVDRLDPAIDPDAWQACGTDTPIDLASHRRNVALCVDLALDGSHATLAAAAVVDGLVHVEIVHHWEGRGCTRDMRESLPGIVARVKPGAIGWFPTGPAAAVAAELAERKGGTWPPAYVKVEEIRGGLTAVCMGLDELVTARGLRHPNDDLLDAHVRSAQRLKRGDAWVFGRQDSGGTIDATYAIAGAAHLARTMAVRAKPKVVTRRRESGLRAVPPR